MSLRDSILASADPALELREYPVLAWGLSVWLRGWTGTERDAFEREFGDLEKQRENLRAKVLVRCLLDAEGNRIFTDADAIELGKKSAAALDPLFAEVMRLSGLTRDTQEQAKGN